MDGDCGDLAEFGKKRNTDYDSPPSYGVGKHQVFLKAIFIEPTEPRLRSW